MPNPPTTGRRFTKLATPLGFPWALSGLSLGLTVSAIAVGGGGLAGGSGGFGVLTDIHMVLVFL